MKKLLLMTLVSTIATSSAFAEDVYSDEFQTVHSAELYELKTDVFGAEVEELVPRMPNHFLTNSKSKAKKAVSSDDLDAEIKRQLEELAKGNAGKPTTKKPTTKKPTTSKGSSALDNATKVIKITKDLIALGKEVYDLVEKGRPVYNETSKAIRILPRQAGDDLSAALELQNWQMPTVKKYRYKLMNKRRKNVATVEYKVIFSAGGDLNGVGKYISGAQIKPTYVDVKWGWEFNATYVVQDILNLGTHESPVAAAVLMIDFHSKSVLSNRTENRMFAIDGLGNVTPL